MRPVSQKGARWIAHRSVRKIAAAICVGLAATACARPAAMRVRDGTAPRYEDDEVAFRTVYYFRVFDLCQGKAGANNAVEIPTGEALYRFRMTGKSNTLTTRVHFESGTLKSWEIDPIGAGVTYEKGLGRFRFQSRKELDQRVRRERDLQEIRDLLALRKELLEGFGVDPKQPTARGQGGEAVTAIDGLIKANVTALGGDSTQAVSPSTTAQGQGGEAVTAIDGLIKANVTALGGDSTQAVAPSNAEGAPALCQASDRKRGFQILGPEGWKTFDQDDRLILAMAADAEPILKALRELAGRVLNAQKTGGAQLLPIVEERLALRKAEMELLTSSPEEEPRVMVQRVLRAFGENAPKGETPSARENAPNGESPSDGEAPGGEPQ